MEYYVIIGDTVFGRFTDMHEAYRYRDGLCNKYIFKKDEYPVVLMRLV